MKGIAVLLMFWSAVNVGPGTCRKDETIVHCAQGKLLGVVQKTRSGRDVLAFLGVPYAKPPVGELRFKDPLPSDPWLGSLIATKPPNICLQLDLSQSSNVSGSEDCLYLNIYVPKQSAKAENELLDVVVYIHGGGFQVGSANSHSPSYLLDEEDVVLVIVNYRLGVLGFFSLLDEHSPGNVGLKDQAMALKWIRDNIAAFRGDPNKVTLVGCSAGGASVHAHLLSRLSHGLFQKAIITSGVALNPWMFQKHPRQKALKVSEAIGCPTDDHEAMMKCLRQRPAERIVALAHDVMGNLQFDSVQFAPIIEPPSETAFLDASPQEIIASKRGMDVPVLFAYMEDEAIFATAEILSNASTVRKFESNWADELSHMKFFDYEGESKSRVAEAIRNFYLGGDQILENPAKFTEMYSDWGFKVGIEKAAKLHAKSNTSPVYAYVFSHVSNKRYSDYYNSSGIYKGGACHGDDLYYVLETSYLIKRTGEPEDDAMSRTIIELWMRFIRSNVPESWKHVQLGLPHFTYLNISSPNSRDFELRTKTDTAVADFWESMENFKVKKNEQDEL